MLRLNKLSRFQLFLRRLSLIQYEIAAKCCAAIPFSCRRDGRIRSELPNFNKACNSPTMIDENARFLCSGGTETAGAQPSQAKERVLNMVLYGITRKSWGLLIQRTGGGSPMKSSVQDFLLSLTQVYFHGWLRRQRFWLSLWIGEIAGPVNIAEIGDSRCNSNQRENGQARKQWSAPAQESKM